MELKDFARLLGITPQWLSVILNKRLPTQEVAEKMSRITGRPIREFFTDGRKQVVKKYIRQFPVA